MVSQPPADPDRAEVRDLGRIDGCVLDTDGVITRTADVHFAAWKQLFEEYLGAPFTEEDYLAHVDGRPRYDGVDALLRSRGVELERGDPSDPPDRDTVCGLGNRKNTVFRDTLARDGVAAFDSTVAFIEQMRAVGVVVAAVSASENQLAVLEGAGLTGLFDVRVDGVMTRDLGLAGKPDPALFLEASRRLGTAPAVTAVLEDARSGVEAGRRGGFALVIGVDRTGHPDELIGAGADAVVSDVQQLFIDGTRRVTAARAIIGSSRPGARR